MSESKSRETWKSVAIALGNRMQLHAHCEDHDDPAEDADCPFCRDRQAYRMFVDYASKHGCKPRPHHEDGLSVPIHELPYNPHFGSRGGA